MQFWLPLVTKNASILSLEEMEEEQGSHKQLLFTQQRDNVIQINRAQCFPK